MRWALPVWFAMVFPMWAQTSGQELFKAHCAGCHGPSGQGSRGPSLRVPLLKRANDVDSMVSLLRRGVDGSEMIGFPTAMIGDDAVRALAAHVLSLRATNHDAASGRIERGAMLFRTKGKCMDCHRVKGEGKMLAPDLSDIGRRRDLKWLRQALLDPEAEIYDSFEGYRWVILLPDNYLLVDVTTKKGERITGYRLNEDAFSVQIRDNAGRVRSFLKSELADLRKQWGKSPMPSYKDVFSPAELDDILAYLASLR
jgi:cytochrome c oxidase cbb3-type subunit III